MKARCVDYFVREDPLFPSLVFNVEFTREHGEGDIVGVWIVGGNMDLQTPSKGFITVARLHTPHYFIFGTESVVEQIAFDIDPWKLEKFEEFREGRDLLLRINLRCNRVRSGGSIDPERTIILWRNGREIIKIPRSEWVDEILPRLGLKRIRLIEVPVLESVPTEFKDVPNYIEEAWKDYLRGDFDDAIANCRRCLMGIIDGVRKLNCEKYEEDEKTGEKRPVPDWKKFFGGHETLAENFEKIFRGCFGFTQPGSHIGRATTRCEAECAIGTTYAIANFVIKTLTKAKK